MITTFTTIFIIMRKFDLLAAVLFAASFMTLFFSCDKNDGPGKDEATVLEGGEISGRYSADLTLRKGEYTLAGSLQIEAPATLTIEPGTRITAADNGEIIYILIEQGARIEAAGTKDEPILMTAEKKQAGAWGGVHICGRSHTNAGSGNTSEIGNAPYGGDMENDNSGTLRYICIEYSGYALDSEHEANGISLYGVGNGTSISYIQVKDGSDDGIEFFGGSVNIDHCIVENCTDDSFDWTEGWNGKAEYIVAYQGVADCDCLMECDNNGDNNEAAPVSSPVIRYATLVGNGSDINKRGVRLRAGTHVDMSYTIVTGKAKPVTLETVQTVDSFDNGTSSITYTLISGELINEQTVSGSGSAQYGEYDNDVFSQGTGNKSGYTGFSFTGNYVGQTEGCGAVPSDNDWTKGWTL